MRAPLFFGVGFLLYVSAPASFGQTTNQTATSTNTVTVESAGPRPLQNLTVGGNAFENVTLTGFDGKIVAVSHAYGVKDIPVTDLTPDQIDALNRTSEKFKIVLPDAPSTAALEKNIAAARTGTNVSPAAATTTNAVAQTAPPVQVPVENPVALAEAAARTEAMIQEFKAVGRGENESEPEEDVPVRVPGFVRFLIWAACSTVSVLLIFFLTAAFLRRRGKK